MSESQPYDARRYVALFEAHGLPPATGEVLDVKWFARNGDWWHRTAEGWFWLDGVQRKWLRHMLGPP